MQCTAFSIIVLWNLPSFFYPESFLRDLVLSEAEASCRDYHHGCILSNIQLIGRHYYPLRQNQYTQRWHKIPRNYAFLILAVGKISMSGITLRYVDIFFFPLEVSLNPLRPIESARRQVQPLSLNPKIPPFSQSLYYKALMHTVLCDPTQASIGWSQWPRVWAGWVLLNHFTDEEIEGNRI